MQAEGLSLERTLVNMEPVDLYDQDLWPGVTCLIVSEMAKRSWALFKLYLNNVSLELGRSSNLDDMKVEQPTLFDDEVEVFIVKKC